MDVQAGSTITNGASAIRLVQHVGKNGRWGIAGWMAINISLEASGEGTSAAVFLPDYLVKTWRAVAWEWQPLGESGLEHRYVWEPSPGREFGWLRHETQHALVSA